MSGFQCPPDSVPPQSHPLSLSPKDNTSTLNSANTHTASTPNRSHTPSPRSSSCLPDLQEGFSPALHQGLFTSADSNHCPITSEWLCDFWGTFHHHPVPLFPQLRVDIVAHGGCEGQRRQRVVQYLARRRCCLRLASSSAGRQRRL